MSYKGLKKNGGNRNNVRSIRNIFSSRVYQYYAESAQDKKWGLIIFELIKIRVPSNNFRWFGPTIWPAIANIYLDLRYSD